MSKGMRFADEFKQDAVAQVVEGDVKFIGKEKQVFQWVKRGTIDPDCDGAQPFRYRRDRSQIAGK